MRLGKCKVENFGSYKNFEFDFSNTGLALIHGITGSGKSTICDVASWCLFGQTAKGGSVDDVKNWAAEGELTTGEIEVDVGAFHIHIYRVRGKAAQNDLYYKKGYEDEKLRGKDITDTQKQIEQYLGVTSDQYFTGAYFNEFSPTSTFFLDKPKARREVFENIADLSLPVRLSEKVAESRKSSKKELDQIDLDLSKNTGALELAKANQLRIKASLSSWEVSQKENLLLIEEKIKNFDQEKSARLEAIANEVVAWDESNEKSIEKAAQTIKAHKAPKTPVSPYVDLHKELIAAKHKLNAMRGEKCDKCGGAVEHEGKDATMAYIQDLNSSISIINTYNIEHIELQRQLTTLQEKANPHKTELSAAVKQTNPYIERLEYEKGRENPHRAPLSFSENEIRELTAKGVTLVERKIALEARIAALTHLYELSYTLRAKLLKNAVAGIQGAINRCLTSYFDAALKVEFKMVDSDSLDVYIEKDGNPCNYKQLSKGQRGLLKLAFITSIMQASANSHGIHFDTLFFDESLEGLDGQLKSKAFTMFEDLSKNHSTVIVIDHDEKFQSLFDKTYLVSLAGDYSTIVQE